MRFSIVTPSFRNSKWLKLCIASVADQEVEHEHLVQDSCSDDGTQFWLPHEKRVDAVIEKDGGMYDAINRGYKRSRGELLAHLNCDEQYLPGALKRVSEFFDRHPDVDVVFGNCVVVDANGQYVCDRTALTPELLHTMVAGNLSFLTAGTFLRREVVIDRSNWFDPKYRVVGDAEWTLRLIKSKVRMKVLNEFVTAFTDTRENLSLGPNAMRERAEFFARAPGWAQAAAPLIVSHYRLRRLVAGAYFPKPHRYAIYTQNSPDQRQEFEVLNPTYRWRW